MRHAPGNQSFISEQLLRASNSTGQNISTGGTRILQYPNIAFNPHNLWDGVNHRFEPIIEGYYFLHAQIAIQSLGDGKYVTGSIYVNAVAYVNNKVYNNTGGAALTYVLVSDLLYFNGSTDYADFRVYHNHGGTRVTDTSSSNHNMAIFRVL
jgi:hypothetical protein